MTIAREVQVTGRVQGVFFRAWTREQAEELGVAGWVRNRSDGSVEARLEGDESSVTQLIERMRRGPPAACVEDVRVEEVATEQLQGFDVKR